MAADVLVDAGVRRVDIALVPLPYARIAVGGIVPQIADWTDRFAGVVDVVVELGPPALAPSARIELARIVEGERHPIRELHRGSEPPDQFLIDTTALEDGTYEIAVEVYGIEGLTAVSTARFGVRNWEVRVDNLLPPVQNTWFGEQSRKQTALESPGWAYSTDLPNAYFGDADRLIRSQQGEAWLVWEAPQLHSFEATIYALEPGDVDAVLSIAVSPDGVTWTPISFEHTASDTSGAGWHRVEVTGFVPREIGAAFLRLAIAGDEPSGTGIELGQVRLRSYFGE